jgi:lincosamide nucleotidyltransferase
VSLEPHTRLDACLRDAMHADERITHALAYGSFTQGTADSFSDLEYWLFLAPAAELDVREWPGGLMPIQHFVVNEFGTFTAILPGLLRVELPAVPNTQLAKLEDWGNEHLLP